MSDWLTDFESHLWNEGRYFRAYEKLGAHPDVEDGRPGFRFLVWAPNASNVSVIGDFNDWDPTASPMSPVRMTGLWEAFLPGVAPAARYKYFIRSTTSYEVAKADPYGFAAELRPQTASVTCDLTGYQWNDSDWLATRRGRNSVSAPISIYEVHLGSWRRGPEGRWLTYQEAATQLAEYVHHAGYTHVELLPVAEHPFDGSWGYQATGYYAPTRRFGTPHDFMAFVDVLHQAGIGVILDWVPAHFPKDEHGLAYFDGTHLYEYADPRIGEHRQWGTYVFNFGRPEVINFLISNAIYWLDKYHVDGLRVDAVASMLYLDYSRGPGEWIPNPQGGHENLEAVRFLQTFNTEVSRVFPDAITIAEESTAWPGVCRGVDQGGLGFGAKWDMGWMHDTLDYVSLDPIQRKHHHNQLTFRQVYAFTENYVLPISHDEVTYGKRSLLEKMPGDEWQKFANLRTLLGYMFTQPGKKLLYMGCDIGERTDWNHDAALNWDLLNAPAHRGLQRWVRDLNTTYRGYRALHALDCEAGGFEWIDCCDTDVSVISYLRKSMHPVEYCVIVCNFTPVPRHNYRIGVPLGGHWKEILNSDARLYAGSGQGNAGELTAAPLPMHGREYLLTVTLPPLAVVVFAPVAQVTTGSTLRTATTT